MPADLGPSFRVITVNGSQAVTEGWGLGPPDITLLQFNQIEGTNTNAIEVRRVLSAEGLASSMSFSGARTTDRIWKQGLAAFDYGYDELDIVDRYERNGAS